MARVRMVTRTINSTLVNALCVNPTTKEVEEKEITLAGTFDDDKALSKAVAKLNTETQVVVSIYGSKVISKLYGMTEQMFLENASVIEKDTEASAEADTETVSGFNTEAE